MATAVTTFAIPRTWFGQVAGHGIHAVGQVLPRASNTLNDRLPAQFAFRADLRAPRA